MPAKMLEKALKDGAKESRCVFGAKEVMSSMSDAKLVVVSAGGPASEAAAEAAGGAGVPSVRFEGGSVALGKACGLQFRVSAVSFREMPDAGVSSIIAESGRAGSNGLNEAGRPPAEGTPAP